MPDAPKPGPEARQRVEERKAARAAGRAAWIAANPQKHAAEQAALVANRKRIKDALKAAKDKKDKEKGEDK